MVENNFINQINREIDAHHLAMDQLDQGLCNDILLRVCKTFLFNLNNLFLWESDNEHASIIHYSENWDEKYYEITSFITDEAYLVITDSEWSPWPMFKGNVSEFKTLLENLRYCEYFIVDAKFKRVIFDTHHNSFILFENISNE